MKKITSILSGLSCGLMLSATAQATPLTYRIDDFFAHIESHRMADGSVVDIGINGPLIPSSKGFSITFSYDSSVPLTQAALPPNAPNYPNMVYLEVFDAPGALTGITGSLGNYGFDVDVSNTLNFSFKQTNLYGEPVFTRLWAEGSVASSEGDFSAAFVGQNFRLTNISLSFFSGPVGTLPLNPLAVAGSSPNVQLLLTGDDGTTISAYYVMGRLTAVPLPGTFWLFGSGLLAPAMLRMRRQRAGI